MVLRLPYYFFKSLSYMRNDKKVMLYSIIPVLIGFICYYFLGTYMFDKLEVLAREFLMSYVTVSGWVENLIQGLVGLVVLVFVNFTFFIFVSIIASPFNDIISERIEVMYKLDPKEQTFSDVVKKLPSMLINEFKKVILIFLCSIFNFIVGIFVPPLGFILTGLLFAVSFVDYSWSRRELTPKECIGEIKKGFLPFMLGGSAFMFLISIPILNLFFLPVAVVFFTTLNSEIRSKNA